ncbi:hypothetical protein [Dyadobacter psychrophilus]|uniref:Uncharacterized protein n=1 Tax=Dyadobacter psychrophilus TaxID=651661 RepID=A0A1T5DF48_9BACT|nr:hypothetical protein [Dyadobacter psychrophilus]SKB70332.1 hypothetical protein SAMN05660293_01576 [Dyadobacter psychrophilus]
MQESELIALWQSYNQKLEENLVLNRQNASAITLIKVKSLISSMVPMKIFVIITTSIWVTFLVIVLYRTFAYASPFFWFSIATHAILVTVVIAIYVYQVVLIYQTDLNEALLKTQYRLASLKSSTLWIYKLMFLHAPVWTTFTIQQRMFSNPAWLTAQIIVSLVFLTIALWLFVNIKYENRGKKWFRMIFNGRDWDPMIKSFEMLRQIKGYD